MNSSSKRPTWRNKNSMIESIMLSISQAPNCQTQTTLWQVVFSKSMRRKKRKSTKRSTSRTLMPINFKSTWASPMKSHHLTFHWTQKSTKSQSKSSKTIVWNYKEASRCRTNAMKRILIRKEVLRTYQKYKITTTWDRQAFLN